MKNKAHAEDQSKEYQRCEGHSKDCKFHIQFQHVVEKWIEWTLTGVRILSVKKQNQYLNQGQMQWRKVPLTRIQEGKNIYKCCGNIKI